MLTLRQHGENGVFVYSIEIPVDPAGGAKVFIYPFHLFISLSFR